MKRRRTWFRRLCVCALLLTTTAGCSSFTSIERTADGRYVISGWQAPGPRGFIWICEYDEATNTMRIVEELP